MLFSANEYKGFIKTVVIQIHIHMPRPDKAKRIPCLTKRGEKALKLLAKPGADRVE